ncbi:MAG TPA: ribbon-helix-helix protein, CopG family [Vicinamibacterales bacterium]|nr:ribbon-helix-helix protein, CopG family [Vicinamibacterales bacterium]
MIPKRRGRPALSLEPTHPITSRVPQSHFDSIARLAIRRGVSVHGIVREAIASFVASNRHHRDRVPH